MSNDNSSTNDEFFIGYMPKAPRSFARLTTIAVVILLIFVVVAALLQAQNQRELQVSNFEFGEISEITGYLSATPVPNLIIEKGNDLNGNMMYQSVLLVGLGKFGADSLVQHFENQMNIPLAQAQVTLKGSLFYSDGKTLLELTDQENALVKYERTDASHNTPLEKLGEQEVRGEIVDAKCYFGVMNPGYGKPHRSCAIRCVSGGIPPILWARQTDGSTSYFIVLDKNGNTVNQEVLPHIADPVCVKGDIHTYYDWNIIYADMDNIRAMGCSAISSK